MTTTTTAVATIGTAELQERLRRGDGLQFWNVLTDEYFKDEMIPGSRRVPLDRIGREAAGVAKDAEIVVYCAGPQCPQSRLAAEKLGTLGFERVRAYEGGIEEWRAAGHPIDTLA
jgi:rhodanese-related sulfurtransferase